MFVRQRFLRAAAALVVCFLGIASTGCASAPETFGNRARFSPAFAGYVMAPESGSDDPDRGERVLLLRDPLTGDKLRCQKDVEAWREVHEDFAADQLHDEKVDLAVGITGGILLGPFAVVEPVGAGAMIGGIAAVQLVYDDLSSDDAFELMAGGVALYERKRYRQAIALLERALAKDSTVGFADKAYYYLGLSYAKLGQKPRAKLAFTLFVDRAGVRDVDAYREAEAALKKLGVERRPCASSDPVELHW